MRWLRGRWIAAALLLAAASCGGDDGPSGSLDGGGDAARPDATRPEAGPADAGPDGPALPPCDGCWDDTGRCRPGDEDAACGVGGGSCLSCGAEERCRAGVCVAAPACGPGSCGGCCTAEGLCVDGSSPAACGAGGAACEACPEGVPCVGGVCDPTAVPCASSCAGCCTPDGTCVDPPTDAACGSAGARCEACGPVAACVEGACQLDPSGRWDVTALEATVPMKDPDGEDWDPGWGEIRRPDVALRASVFRDGVAVEGEVGPVDDTFTPAWNEVVLRNLPPETLLGRDGIGFALRDVDPLNPDDPIGSCVYVPTAADFDSRRIEIACGEGVTLIFRLEPH